MMIARCHSLLFVAFASIAIASQSASAAAIGQLTNELYNSSGAVGGSNYTNASSIPVNTVNDTILGATPFATNYVACCEAGGPPAGTTAPMTDGTMGPGNNAASSPTTVVFDNGNNFYLEYAIPAAAPNVLSASVYTGHQDDRVNQGYDILVSKDGTNFTSLSDGSTQTVLGNHGSGFSYEPSGGDGGAARSTVSPISGLYLGTGIKFVEFVALGDNNNQNGPVFRELTVQSTPEPSSFVLGGLGVVGVVLAARRRRKA